LGVGHRRSLTLLCTCARSVWVLLTTPPSPNKARSGARQFGEWIVKMSKNTRDAKFRTVDVDEYDEDKFRDDAEAAEEESNEAGQLASRESEVKKLVSANNLTAALRAVLADPPINTKEVQLKVSPSVRLPQQLAWPNAFQADDVVEAHGYRFKCH